MNQLSIGDRFSYKASIPFPGWSICASQMLTGNPADGVLCHPRPTQGRPQTSCCVQVSPGKGPEISFNHDLLLSCPVILESDTAMLCAKFQNDWATEIHIMDIFMRSEFQMSCGGLSTIDSYKCMMSISIETHWGRVTHIASVNKTSLV